MPTRRFIYVAYMLLGGLLLVAAMCIVVLYNQAHDYYVQLYNVRLDPLGLSVYAGTPVTQDANSSGKPVVVFFGDSRAADWTPPAQITDAIFVNRGVGNQTTAQALGRLPYDVLPLHPNVVVIQVGINDLKTIPLFPERQASIVANCKANIREIVEQCEKNRARVILTTIFPVGQVPLERRLFWSDDIDPAIREVNQYIFTLKGERVTVLDTMPILADEQGRMNPLYSRDTLHLNAQGYAALNIALTKLIEP